MATRRRRRFILLQTGWLLVVLTALVISGTFTYEFYFLSSLTGSLLVTTLTDPAAVSPRWRRRVWWLTVASLLAFGAVVIRWLYEILNGTVI